MAKKPDIETDYIGICSPFQGAGKTLAAILLTDAIYRTSGGDAVELIDGDGSNADAAGTSYRLLQLKPRRNRGWTYCRAGGFANHNKIRYGIVDAGRSMSSLTQEIIRDDCKLVIIPILIDPQSDPGEKSLADGYATWEAMTLDGKQCAILPVLRNGGENGGAQKIKDEFKRKPVIYLPAIRDESYASRLVNKGLLPVDCDPGEEDQAEEVEQRFDRIAKRVLDLVNASADAGGVRLQAVQ